MNQRMFLVEKGRYVTVRSAFGDEATFNDFGEFGVYYPAIDLTGKTYLDYEVDRDSSYLIVDKAASVRIYKENPTPGDRDLVRIQLYEDVIDEAVSLLLAKEDPYYFLNLAEAKARRISDLKDEARTLWNERYDLLDMSRFVLDDAASKATAKVKYDLVAAAFIAARNEVNDPLTDTVQKVKDITATWPTI